MTLKRNTTLIILMAILLTTAFCSVKKRPEKYDVVIYGGTSAGITAAIQTSRMGKSVLLIEPSQRFGGLTTGGLGATDIGFSTDFIGQNYEYPEASYEEREKTVERHRKYQQGLMWTLANHPRIPQKVRAVVSKWGTCKDEFKDNEGWSGQLYIREARRLKSNYVMTQRHCEGLGIADDPVGLGAYGMDSHHVQRYVDNNGFVQNEGNVEAPVPGPYPISYRSIVPENTECSNLLVPVCLSATHIAYGSIRMEPVFMILGQSAATAACIAIDKRVKIQEVAYQELKTQLLNDKQILNVIP